MKTSPAQRHDQLMPRAAALGLLLLCLGLLGCNRSEPIVVIQLHPKNPDILYVTTNDDI